MAIVNISNNGHLSNLVAVNNAFFNVYGSASYGSRVSYLLNGLNEMDFLSSTDLKENGYSVNQFIGGVSLLGRSYTVNMTGNISEFGSTLSIYDIIHNISGERITFFGNLVYPGLPILTEMSVGSVLSSVIGVSAPLIVLIEGSVTKGASSTFGTINKVGSMFITENDGVNFVGFGSDVIGSINISMPNSLASDLVNVSGSISEFGVARVFGDAQNFNSFNISDYILFNGISLSVNDSPNADILGDSDEIYLTGTVGFSINSSDGDDIIFRGGSGRDNQINGGDGIDTLVVSGLPSQYSFSGSTLTGADGVDTLTSIELIRFGASLGNDQLITNLTPSQLVDPDGNGPRLSPVNELIKSFSVLYIAYFNRSPDIEGFMYWFKELNSGNMTLSQVSSSFTQQPEYRAAYSAGSSNREFIAQIYQNLFDRTPDTEGWNFWENELNNGSPRDVFILTVINGAYAPTGGASDRALLDNKHAVSLHYTEQLSSFPTEAFDRGISTVLNRVTENPATVNQGLAVIDHVMDNPITLTGLISDAQAFNAFWGA